MVTNHGAYIVKEWEKNLKAFQEINASLESKDKRALELLKNVNTLTDRVIRLNSQLEEAKLIIMQSY